MTPNEIQMLVCGLALGAQLMNLLHVLWDRQDARRSRAAAEAARKKAFGDLYFSSLSLYQLQQRSRV